MDEIGETMVNNDETVTSQDRTEYTTPAHLEPTRDDGRISSDSGNMPEYATITRMRPHDPPSYLNRREDPGASKKDIEKDEREADEQPPEDELERRREEDEDKIEVISLLVDEESRKDSNGCPPGAGWAIAGAAMAGLASSSGSDKGDGSKDPSFDQVAGKNSKILEQFEDKKREKDECLVDCIYYTTTCCECVIL